MSVIGDHMESLLSGAIEPGRPRDLCRTYTDVMSGRISSRHGFASAYGLRSTSVSDIVNSLIQKKLIYEVSEAPVRRGRPAKKLVLNPDAFAVCVVRISSQTLICSAVNVTGQIIQETRRALNSDCGNAGMIAGIRALYRHLLDGLPSTIRCVAIVLSLPGVLDIARRSWIMSSRWPEIDDLAIGEGLDDLGLPVRVIRNIDAELRARTFGASANTALLHWGYGIGMAYSEGGEPVNSRLGRFGEIGHWSLGEDVPVPCRCGRSGCLETSSALWALWPELVRVWPELSSEEENFLAHANEFPLLDNDRVRQAVTRMVAVLGNVCRVLFPSKVLLSGPFFANDAVLAEFYKAFLATGVLPHVAPPKLVYAEQSGQLETEGAMAPVVIRELAEILSA